MSSLYVSWIDTGSSSFTLQAMNIQSTIPFDRAVLKEETGAVFGHVFPLTTHWPHYGGGGGVNARPAFKDR